MISCDTEETFRTSRSTTEWKVFVNKTFDLIEIEIELTKCESNFSASQVGKADSSSHCLIGIA